MTNDLVPTYHSHIPAVAAELAEHGSIGMMVVDASSLTQIEEEYGHAAFEDVRERVEQTLRDHAGREHRKGDVWVVDEPGGMRFMLFLERKRRKSLPLAPADFNTLRRRLLASVVPHIERACFPFLRLAPRIDVAHGLALHNPLLSPEHIIRQALSDATVAAAHLRAAEDLEIRERLQDLIVRQRIVTAFQPILLLRDRAVLGFEGLSRGARGTGFHTADEVFGAAARHGLSVELDRLCRTRALLSSGRLPSNARLFVNTLPSTIHDPEFRGKPLIDFLDKAQVSPDRIVIEITEKLVIQNYAMFREAMGYFRDLGMSFAVDDVGAGYSGLEAIARLKPDFLKIDIALVRECHANAIHRAMIQAIIAISREINATVIAEGIAHKEEADALERMGIDFGQGFHLARPDPGPDQA